MTDRQAPGEPASIPVTNTGIPIRNLWYLLLYAWHEAALLGKWRAEVETAPNLDALLASLLANLLQQRLRIGLGRTYRDEAQRLRGIRGRIDFTESLKRLAFDNGEAHCHVPVFTINGPKNQIIRATLAYLAQVGQFGSETPHTKALRQRLRRLVRDLEEVDFIAVTSDLLRRQHLGRNDEDYRLMLALCELVFQRRMPTEAEGVKPLPGLDRDEMTLHRVFERFVANFYQHHLTDWQVTAQAPLAWHAEKGSSYLPAMRADLRITHRATGRLIVLDTKFTPHSLRTSEYGKAVFDASHLYQLYAYLRSQEHLSAQHRAAAGILLYPTVKQHLSEESIVQGHSIRIETVDLAKPWPDIETRLLGLVR